MTAYASKLTLSELALRIRDGIRGAREKAGSLSWRQVEEAVAGCLTSVAAPQRPVKAAPKAFGDRKVIPPTPEEVATYSASIGYPLDGSKWCDFYKAKGWFTGRTKMVDWQATVRNWKTNGWGQGTVALRIAIKTDLAEPVGWRESFPESTHANTPWTLIDSTTQKLIISQMRNKQ
jgi:hypothetical protein